MMKKLLLLALLTLTLSTTHDAPAAAAGGPAERRPLAQLVERDRRNEIMERLYAAAKEANLPGIKMPRIFHLSTTQYGILKIENFPGLDDINALINTAINELQGLVTELEKPLVQYERLQKIYSASWKAPAAASFDVLKKRHSELLGMITLAEFQRDFANECVMLGHKWFAEKKKEMAKEMAKMENPLEPQKIKNLNANLTRMTKSWDESRERLDKQLTQEIATFKAINTLLGL
jgi:hypothetical protein